MKVPITSSDAQNNWYLVNPFEYLCDSEQIDLLLRNLTNFRLGAYIGPADAEGIDTYGFREPRLSLKLHMDPGTTNVLQKDGSILPTDWPESSVEIIVGAARNEYVDYVLYDGEIYTTSHFTLEPFMNISPMSYVSRYPVMMALADVADFRVQQDHVDDHYIITREEVAGEDSMQSSYVYSVTCNGTTLAWDTFSAAYARLQVVSVSGTLPGDWQPDVSRIHTQYVLTNTSGSTHTIALTEFDALHDAVIVDGCARFYLVKGGMSFSLTEANMQ